MGHTAPHAPQLETSARRSTSHPFDEARSQSARPVLQTKLQRPPSQRGLAFEADGHGTTIEPAPIASHTRRSDVDAQVTLNGTQVCDTHAPASQRSPAPQGWSAREKPSSLHTARVVAPSHVTARGVQTRARQAPSTQPSPDAQSVSVWARPRSSQTRTRVALTHARDRGVHARSAHSRSPPHTSSPPQSPSSMHSTQTPRSSSQTCARSVHSRVERQLRGASTQPPF